MRNRILIIVVIIISLTVIVLLGLRAVKDKVKLTVPPIIPLTITPTSVPVATSMPIDKVFLEDEVTGTRIWRVSNTEGFTTHAYYDISPWSPDGSQIVWSTQTSFRTSDIYVTEVESGQSGRVVQGAGAAFESLADPVWVSNTVLYFVGSFSGDPNVYATDIFSGKIWQVTKHSGIFGLNAINLNSDKTKMAYFYSIQRGGKLRFAVAAIDGTLIREVTENPDGEGNIFHPKWSPTDPYSLLYFNRGSPKKLWILNTKDFTSKFIATFSDHGMWCPDGTCVVFNDFVGSSSEHNSRVHIINIDGSSKRMVADGNINTFHAHPTLSPDGNTIVIDPRFDKTYGNHILFIDIKTGTIKPLVSNAWAGRLSGSRQELHAHPVWSRDGSMILYAALESEGGAKSNVYIVFVK